MCNKDQHHKLEDNSDLDCIYDSSNCSLYCTRKNVVVLMTVLQFIEANLISWFPLKFYLRLMSLFYNYSRLCPYEVLKILLPG